VSMLCNSIVDEHTDTSTLRCRRREKTPLPRVCQISRMPIVFGRMSLLEATDIAAPQ
jgi:hypothetical protein